MRLKRYLAMAAALTMLRMGSASAQSLDELGLQVHGYATQGFVYSTKNNWNTTDSSDGSAAWTEAVVNLTAQPGAKLRVGVQARYFLLGAIGNQITLDWAQADYKVNEFAGFRAGKVKSPTGLLNESQDIDPAQLWVLLPQSIYPLSSRNALLSHDGGVFYGKVSLGESMGKLKYEGYGGERVLAANDGFLQPERDAGLVLPNGLTGTMFGGTLIWLAPVRGLLVGATEDSEHPGGQVVAGPMQGTFAAKRFYQPYWFAQYEHGKVMLGGEYNRTALHPVIQLVGIPRIDAPTDIRSFYVMGSYKLAAKLTAGVYYSSASNRDVYVSSARFQKDWAISARYDFNSYLYAKAEEHVMDGTQLGYSVANNAGGLSPNTRMTMLKVGVSF